MEHTKKSSGTSKAALALGITGTSLGVLAGGGVLGNLFGVRPNGFGYPAGTTITVDASGNPIVNGNCNCYVTEKEMCLIRENGAKDAVIAKLEAEKYAEFRIAQETRPLENRICELEKVTAVNSARDSDFRRYVNAEFVHQPKASIRESIVVCKQCGCDCERDRGCDCHH